VLVHVVDGFPIDGSDPIENFRTIESELAKYSEELAGRRTIVVMTKTDLAAPEDTEVMLQFFREAGVEPIPISAATGYGIKDLTFKLAAILDEAEKVPVHVVTPVFRRTTDPAWDAERAPDGAYEVVGERIERLVHMTRLSDHDSLRYLHRRLDRIGVIEKLRDMGIKEGDTVRIADWEFVFEDW
jgi:GTP-binding protein